MTFERSEDGSLSADQLTAAIDLLPEFVAHHWTNGETKADFDVGKFLCARMDVAKDLPGLWGKFISFSANDASQWRSELVASVSTEMTVEDYSFYRAVPNLVPFRLELPAEARLLPSLARALMADFFGTARLPWAEALGAQQHATPLQRYNALVDEYVGEIKRLQTIIENPSGDVSIRSAAVMFEALHPEGGLGTLAARSETLVRLSSESIHTVLMVCCCSEILSADEDLRMKTLLGAMLDRGRLQWHRLKNLNWFLSRWRSRSMSPVNRAKPEVFGEIVRFLRTETDLEPNVPLNPAARGAAG